VSDDTPDNPGHEDPYAEARAVLLEIQRTDPDRWRGIMEWREERTMEQIARIRELLSRWPADRADDPMAVLARKYVGPSNHPTK